LRFKNKADQNKVKQNLKSYRIEKTQISSCNNLRRKHFNIGHLSLNWHLNFVIWNPEQDSRIRGNGVCKYHPAIIKKERGPNRGISVLVAVLI
jgi:hypothetical protein